MEVWLELKTWHEREVQYGGEAWHGRKAHCEVEAWCKG